MDFSLTYLEKDGSGPAALRIHTAPSDLRTPTHFIALIDISESMEDKGKLIHVKHCMSLLVKFLTADDCLSLVSFGDESTILLNRVKTDATQLPIIEKAIDSLEVSGCTNYSAGLGSVRQILESPSTQKPGLLSFTDGHANRGVFDPASLNSMICRMHELYPTLSFSFVAYGTDHNATLLKSMADSVMGSYSIVESLEGSATAMGDCIGGILSCSAQNVTVEFPAGSRADGPHTITVGRLSLGDLYSGIDTTILVELTEGPVKLAGVSLPSLDPFQLIASTRLDTTPNVEICVTRLRYRCAALFTKIRDSVRGTNFVEEIAEFRAACSDPALAEHPVIPMLKSEILSMEAALANIALGATRGLEAQLTQHAAFTSMLRGTTTSIQSHGGEPGRGRVRFNSEVDDPNEPAILTSPMRSARQVHMTSVMREASTGGGSL
jgi:hypothetical protein